MLSIKMGDLILLGGSYLVFITICQLYSTKKKRPTVCEMTQGNNESLIKGLIKALYNTNSVVFYSQNSLFYLIQQTIVVVLRRLLLC